MRSPFVRSVRLAPREVERLKSWTRAAAPDEACGVFLGHRAEEPTGARVEVVEVLLGRNLATAAARAFELHPEDHLAAELAAQAAGLEVVGVWHSHPNGTAAPSAADRADAWESWVHAIVGRSGAGELEVRAFGFAAGAQHELVLER
jgi:proteasome lid subunit RPN8/RPN11